MNEQLCVRWMEYAASNVSEESGTLMCLAAFLRREAELAMKYLPDADGSVAGPYSSVPAGVVRSTSPKRGSVAHVTKQGTKCSFCNSEGHLLTKCEQFLQMSVDDRYQWVTKNRKCYRCLLFSHPAKNCRISKYLHNLLRKPKDVTAVDGVHQCSINSKGANASVFLKVVPVIITGVEKSVCTYALLDEGATVTLIDSDLANEIGADGPTDSLRLQGVTFKHTEISKRVQLSIRGRMQSQSEAHSIHARTMNNLRLSLQSISRSDFTKYNHIKDVEDSIDWYGSVTPKILIGQDNWPLIVTHELRSGEKFQPVASRTALGWVLHGCTGQLNYKRNTVYWLFHCQQESNFNNEIDTLIRQSYDLDSLGIQPQLRINPSIEKALGILNRTTKRIQGNEWETGLLWAKDNNSMPSSDKNALKSFYTLENKLKKNPILAKAYSTQINRLLELEFAEPCQGSLLDSKEGWVLPHFAAINSNKPEKVRIVFNCAAKSQGVCLNDYLLTGPDLLQSLLGVLFKFRQAPIAMTADIKDMFLKIKIRKEDQKFQKFYWREPGNETPPRLYIMTSMLFGATCSPSSAIYVKNKNAQEFIKEYPEAVCAIEQNHYCDDYIDSCATESQAKEMAHNIIKIHECGNFDIRNWASNSSAVLQSIPEQKRAHGNIELTPEASVKEKTLGMIWQPNIDMLSFNLSMNRVPKLVSSGQARPTKRQMLAVVMSIFDPIGLLSPFTIKGKILLQEVWRSNVEWDDELLDNEYQKWQQWLYELRRIKECAIPRCYISRNDEAFIQLHTFCDASNKAYAAACYLRYAYPDGEIRTVLVAAKARVTPLKPCSVPRLELQAALLGARLAHTVSQEHKIQIDEKYYWSDSIITIAWIRSDPRNYKAFVAHRLSAIDDLTRISQWRWVPTECNSADIPTRDSTPLDLSLHGRWFSGPEFLKKPKEDWPVEKNKIVPAEATCEEKEEKINMVIRNDEEYSLPNITSFSSWKKLIRATAYVLLFICKCKKSRDQVLTLDLMKKAEELWIKKVQNDCFSKEMLCLQNENNLPVDSKITQLTPVLDEEGIMRLGGRIDRVPDVAIEMKRPVILSGNHDYTKLLIHHYHKQQNHASIETVINELRQLYWITKIRSTVRSVAHHCQFCKIKRAIAMQPPMGDLPYARLQHHQRPFSFCGLDYFGPMEVTIGRRKEKRWGALFTCMVTRAVHIELAASLTSDAVIMAIRRFIARRGCPTEIHSDNGTNFKGAETELKKAWAEVDKEAISDDMMNRGIKWQWHYIPATAAHMGGVWERLVQSIKKALKVTLQERAPREEVLATLMAEAELTVNSRPLTFISVDPRDPEALTPYHFLIGSSSAAPAPGKFNDKDLMLRKQWKVAQRLADMFWSRWIREYLPTLLDRKMKGTVNQNIKEGQLVIVVDQNLPRNVWPRGVVTKIFPGQDAIVRVVEVRTAGGVFRRPVNKIVILPVARDDDSSSDTDASVNCLDFWSRLQ